MELPQPRPFGAEGKKPTHDFLSLYSDPSFQPQDPRSSQEPSEKLAQYPPFASRASGFNPMMTSSNQFQGGQKNQGFMEMLRSVKGLPEDEDDDEDEYVKKEVTSHKEDFGVKVDGKGIDQRANTPRSKHSATEQRRRSKINDRFLILRQLIPHSDQKRDKASFLLEVIEYIQFLQEKVQKYEAAFPGCNQDSMKFSPWKHSHGMGESIVDHSQIMKSGGAGSGLMFAGKFEDNGVAATSSMLGNAQIPAESDNVSSDTPYKATDHHPGLATKAATAAAPLQQSVYNSVGRNSGIIPPQNRFLSDAENMASQPQQHLGQRSVPADSGMSNEQEELTIEGGTIHLSSVYSQGLLSSLTKALQSSGIDLSQANVSVQIDLGKRAITRPGNTSSAKDHEDPLSCNRTMAHSRGASSADDSDQVQKRPRIDRR